MAAEILHLGQIRVVEPEPPSREDLLYLHFSGAFMGGAIADALGWPTEFAKTPDDLERVGVREYPVTDFVPWHKQTGGRFFARTDYIQPGDYSDDTQLMISVARSLLPDGTVDNEYFAKCELRFWLGFARGAGATVTAAAKAAAKRTVDWRWNFFRFTRGRHEDLDYRGAGANGAAMRVAPIALANLYDQSQCLVETWKNSIVTHGHARAIMGAIVYAESLRAVIRNAVDERQQSAMEFLSDLRTFVSGLDVPTHDADVRYWLGNWNKDGNEFEPQWHDTRIEMLELLSLTPANTGFAMTKVYQLMGCYAPASKGSGTVAAAAALALFFREGNNYKRIALEAANLLGSDTDTIGAMAGALAGGWLGYTELPQRWANTMADYTYMNRIAQTATLIAARETKVNPLRLRLVTQSLAADLLKDLEQHRVLEKKVYWHPLLGKGTARKVESQQVGVSQNTKGRVMMATVQFDIGQTCKFSSYQGLRHNRSPRRTQKRAPRHTRATGEKTGKLF